MPVASLYKNNVNAPQTVARLLLLILITIHSYYRSTTKDVTDSDAFTKTSLPVTRLLKDATDSDVFAPRHCQ
jgi:hypothetical protein